MAAVKPDNSHSDQSPQSAQVLPFRPRGEKTRAQRPQAGAPQPPALESLAKYEGADVDDNYRHRMMVNLAGLLVTVALAVIGVWLAVQIADLRKKQDCIFSGRRNCAPIESGVSAR